MLEIDDWRFGGLMIWGTRRWIRGGGMEGKKPKRLNDSAKRNERIAGW